MERSQISHVLPGCVAASDGVVFRSSDYSEG